MPINADFKFQKAEGKFLLAKTDEAKLEAMEEMIKTMPKHKSAEALRKNIKTRYKKIKAGIEAGKKKKRGSGKGSSIKKAELQAVIVGMTNSGKSSLLASLTNANPTIDTYEYTTKQPNIGALNLGGCKIQVIDTPAIENELCDLGIVNTADVLLIVVDKASQIEEVLAFLEKSTKTRIIVFNKSDLLSSEEKRRISAFLQSKKYNFILFSCLTKENLEELKEKIFKSFNKIRIYTREPGKPHDNEPTIMPPGSTVKDVAEKILHGFSEKIKETRITGPSSKFPNQKVGLDHEVKDKDIVEFHIK